MFKRKKKNEWGEAEIAERVAYRDLSCHCESRKRHPSFDEIEESNAKENRKSAYSYVTSSASFVSLISNNQLLQL